MKVKVVHGLLTSIRKKLCQHRKSSYMVPELQYSSEPLAFMRLKFGTSVNTQHTLFLQFYDFYSFMTRLINFVVFREMSVSYSASYKAIQRSKKWIFIFSKLCLQTALPLLWEWPEMRFGKCHDSRLFQGSSTF